jgi:hypothetical protein
MDIEVLIISAAMGFGMILSVVFAFLIRRIPVLPVKIAMTCLVAVFFAPMSFWAVGASTYVLTGSNGVAIPAGILGGAIAAAATFLIVFAKRGQSQRQGTPKVRRGPRKTASTPHTTGPRIPPDVFISYRRDERTDVLQIAERLRALKLKVWFDADLRSGTSFDSEIDWNIRRAKCVLVCWSPGAATSDWVRGEATIGREREVLAAAMLKSCSLPAPFNLVHAEDLTSGVGPENRAWFHLLDRIGALVGRPGLGAYELAVASRDRGAIAAWMGEHPHDPLFDDATALLRSI